MRLNRLQAAKDLRRLVGLDDTFVFRAASFHDGLEFSLTAGKGTFRLSRFGIPVTRLVARRRTANDA
jgi:hypothetical protein